MKTEHEKLKEICDTIGYEIDTSNEYYWYSDSYKSLRSQTSSEEVNVREIIFTPEFKVKLWGYFYHNVESMFEIDLIQNLDDPVEYLYNLLLW